MKTSTIIAIAVILIVAVVGAYFWTQNETVDDTVNIVQNNSNAVPNENDNVVDDYEVAIENFEFQTSELRIKAGDRVIWTNMDSSMHTVTSDTGNELDSPLISRLGTFSYTFNKIGTYEYHCAPHPYMKGKIIAE